MRDPNELQRHGIYRCLVGLALLAGGGSSSCAPQPASMVACSAATDCVSCLVSPEPLFEGVSTGSCNWCLSNQTCNTFGDPLDVSCATATSLTGRADAGVAAAEAVCNLPCLTNGSKVGDGTCCSSSPPIGFSEYAPKGSCPLSNLGDPCALDTDCAFGTCADKTCACLHEQSTCAHDQDCCGFPMSSCTNERCSAACLVGGAFCQQGAQCCSGSCSSQGVCTGGNGSCVAGGSPYCDGLASDYCCSGACYQNACTIGCAGLAQAYCHSSADCGGAVCDGTFCVCAAIGQACVGNADCATSNCVKGMCQCRSTGTPCDSSADCCANICTGGVCGASVGEACQTSDDCLLGHCVNDTCACQLVGGSCSAATDCCSENCDGGTCACAANGRPCRDSASCCSGECGPAVVDPLYGTISMACAMPVGAPCRAETDCGSWLCNSGVCACAPSGVAFGGYSGRILAPCVVDADCCAGFRCTGSGEQVDDGSTYPGTCAATCGACSPTCAAGTCPAGYLCTNGACQCNPSCPNPATLSDVYCGPPSCGGGTCAQCEEGLSCAKDGFCCAPQCNGSDCEINDACGGTCGCWKSGAVCVNHICKVPTAPTCASTGCPSGQTCSGAGTCVVTGGCASGCPSGTVCDDTSRTCVATSGGGGGGGGVCAESCYSLYTPSGACAGEAGIENDCGIQLSCMYRLADGTPGCVFPEPGANDCAFAPGGQTYTVLCVDGTSIACSQALGCSF